MTDNALPNDVAQAIVIHAQCVLPYMAGVNVIKTYLKKKHCAYHTFCESEIQDNIDHSIVHMHVY